MTRWTYVQFSDVDFNILTLVHSKKKPLHFVCVGIKRVSNTNQLFQIISISFFLELHFKCVERVCFDFLVDKLFSFPFLRRKRFHFQGQFDLFDVTSTITKISFKFNLRKKNEQMRKFQQLENSCMLFSVCYEFSKPNFYRDRERITGKTQNIRMPSAPTHTAEEARLLG